MSEKEKVIYDYVCKFAKDQSDPDCKNCDGKSYEVDGKIVVCSENCPSYQKGDKQFQYIVRKRKFGFSAYVLIAMAVVIVLVIAMAVGAFMEKEKYKRENPEQIRDYLNSHDTEDIIHDIEDYLKNHD